MEQKQLFLVAVPAEPISNIARSIREKINKRFKIYGDFKPALHSTVEVIKPQKIGDLIKAKEIITKISRQFAPFPLKVSGYDFFPPPYKAITLAIEKNNQIELLSSLIYEALKEQGINGREDLDSWKFHITLASPFGAVREWTREEYEEARGMVDKSIVHSQCIVDRLELWHPVFDPLKMREAIFPLNQK